MLKFLQKETMFTYAILQAMILRIFRRGIKLASSLLNYSNSVHIHTFCRVYTQWSAAWLN